MVPVIALLAMVVAPVFEIDTSPLIATAVAWLLALPIIILALFNEEPRVETPVIVVAPALVILPFESTVMVGTDVAVPYVAGVTEVFASVLDSTTLVAPLKLCAAAVISPVIEKFLAFCKVVAVLAVLALPVKVPINDVAVILVSPAIVVGFVPKLIDVEPKVKLLFCSLAFVIALSAILAVVTAPVLIMVVYDPGVLVISPVSAPKRAAASVPVTCVPDKSIALAVSCPVVAA